MSPVPLPLAALTPMLSKLTDLAASASIWHARCQKPFYTSAEVVAALGVRGRGYAPALRLLGWRSCRIWFYQQQVGRQLLTVWIPPGVGSLVGLGALAMDCALGYDLRNENIGE